MKYFLFIISTLLLNTLQAQFPVANNGCFTYQYVPTEADTVVDIIPAQIQIIPAVYKDTTYQKVCTPGYTVQYIDNSNGQIKICNKTYSTQYIKIQEKVLIKPEQTVVVKPAYSIKCVTNIRPGYVMQVPCK